MPDDPFLDVLASVCPTLDALKVPYAITGSIASGVHGEPVISQDVDLCVRMTTSQASELATQLPQRFYRSPEALREAAQISGMANLVDMATGLKMDLSVVPREPFYDQVMARRRPITYGPGGPSLMTVTAEDVVLMKLAWRRQTGSRKQWDNALSVLRVNGVRLDWPYLRHWAGHLGIADDLTRLAEEAGI